MFHEKFFSLLFGVSVMFGLSDAVYADPIPLTDFSPEDVSSSIAANYTVAAWQDYSVDADGHYDALGGSDGKNVSHIVMYDALVGDSMVLPSSLRDNIKHVAVGPDGNVFWGTDRVLYMYDRTQQETASLFDLGEKVGQPIESWSIESNDRFVLVRAYPEMVFHTSTFEVQADATGWYFLYDLRSEQLTNISHLLEPPYASSAHLLGDTLVYGVPGTSGWLVQYSLRTHTQEIRDMSAIAEFGGRTQVHVGDSDEYILITQGLNYNQPVHRVHVPSGSFEEIVGADDGYEKIEIRGLQVIRGSAGYDVLYDGRNGVDECYLGQGYDAGIATIDFGPYYALGFKTNPRRYYLMPLQCQFFTHQKPNRLIRNFSLVRTEDSSAVYYIGNDRKRHAFPNSEVFFSWYENFDDVQVISAQELASFPLGSNVIFRPGARLVKVESDPRVYAVDHNGRLRWIESAGIARGLYGDQWVGLVHDVPVTFFLDYEVGESIAAVGAFDSDLERAFGRYINMVLDL